MPVDDSALIYRDEKGSELTFAEMDNRIRALANAHDSLEETVLLAVNEDGTLKNARVGYAADTGASDTYAVTVSGSFADINSLIGVLVLVKANTTNAGASTLAVNGFAATDIKKDHGLDLDHADIVAGKVSAFLYNGTNFQLINPRSRSQVNYGVDVGAANAYKVEFADLAALSTSRFQMPAALYAGYRASFKAINDNTLAACTFEIKITSPSTSLSATIKKNGTLDPVAGDIKSGMIYDVVYDGTYWQISAVGGGVRSYRSTAIPIPTADGRLAAALSHGLGRTPDNVKWRLVNKGNASAVAHGYAVGDKIGLPAFYSTANEVEVFTPLESATVLDLMCRTSLGSRVILTKAATGTVAMTAAELAQDFDFDVYASVTN